MAETKSPEAILQDALTAEQNKSKQLELERNTDREARGKAEQALREANTEKERKARELTTEQTEHAKTKKALTDANSLIDELNKEIGAQPETQKAHTVTLGSGTSAQTYRFLVPQFNLPGVGKVVAEDVKSNSDVLKKLVASGAQVIELVPAKQ